MAYQPYTNNPLATSPIASGLIRTSTYSLTANLVFGTSDKTHTNSTSSYTDAINYTGSGFITLLCHQSTTGTAPDYATMDLIIDGVTVVTSTSAALGGSAVAVAPIVGVEMPYYDGAAKSSFIAGCPVVFKTSLQVRHKLTSDGSGGASSIVRYQYVKTS